jgi:hypothetical protein
MKNPWPWPRPGLRTLLLGSEGGAGYQFRWLRLVRAPRYPDPSRNPVQYPLRCRAVPSGHTRNASSSCRRGADARGVPKPAVLNADPEDLKRKG